MAYRDDKAETRRQIAKFSVDEWISFRKRLEEIECRTDVIQRDKKILKEIILNMKSTAHLAYLARHDEKYSWLKSNRNKPMSVRRIQQILCEYFPEFHIQTTHATTKPIEYKKTRTEQLRLRVEMIDRSRCGRCGATENLEIHHIFPVSLGGTNDKRNMMILCKDCHKLQTDYFRELLKDKMEVAK